MLKAAVRTADKPVPWVTVFPEDPEELPPAPLASYGEEEPGYASSSRSLGRWLTLTSMHGCGSRRGNNAMSQVLIQNCKQW